MASTPVAERLHPTALGQESGSGLAGPTGEDGVEEALGQILRIAAVGRDPPSAFHGNCFHSMTAGRHGFCGI